MKTGRIEKIFDKEFGIITETKTDNSYTYNRMNFINPEIDISTGMAVSFEVRENTESNQLQAHNIKLSISSHSPVISTEKPAKKKKLKYYFKNTNDVSMGCIHIVKKLGEQKGKADKCYNDSELIQNRIDNILTIVLQIVQNINSDSDVNEINNRNDSGENLEFSDSEYYNNSFCLQDVAYEIETISNTPIDKGKQYDFTITWHDWEDTARQYFKSGYQKEHFNYSFVEKGETEQTHVYYKPPKPTEWKLNKIQQKNYEFYIASAPVREIAQASSVPSLPPKLGALETAERVLDKTRNFNEWQREVDPKRIRKISQFILSSNNIIANAPMIYIHDEKAVTIKNDKLIVDYAKFLKKQTSGPFAENYIDRIPRNNKDEFGNIIYDDYRPLWIIDGQHRVKGIHRSNEQEVIIPVIIFPTGFKVENTAKVFAEINTLQTKLNPLHELFMQHRFSIDHTNLKRKFIDFRSIPFEDCFKDNSQVSKDDWRHSRSNHLSYEILAMLAKEGPLKDRVLFLPQNKKTHAIIAADIWINYTKAIFLRRCYQYKSGNVDDYIESPSKTTEKMTTIELFFTEINNYLKAWVDTCNHGEWGDSMLRWDVKKMNRPSLIQRKTHFILLLELYDMVYGLAKLKDVKEDIISKETFMKVLTVFKWVDWQAGEIKQTYGGGGEKGRRSLEVWMADALLHGKQYSREEVLDESIRSKPGRGITSRLGKPTITIISDIGWPKRNKSVVFESIRPINARYEAKWTVTDKHGDIRHEKKISSGGKYLNPKSSIFKLSYANYMKDECNKLTIRVDWQNSKTETGQTKVDISKH